MKKDTTNSSEQENTSNIPSASYYYQRACKREAIRDYKGAAEEYAEMIKLEPNNPEYYFEQGKLYSKAKLYMLSGICFKKVIQYNPLHHEAYYYLSICFSE